MALCITQLGEILLTPQKEKRVKKNGIVNPHDDRVKYPIQMNLRETGFLVFLIHYSEECSNTEIGCFSHSYGIVHKWPTDSLAKLHEFASKARRFYYFSFILYI